MATSAQPSNLTRITVSEPVATQHDSIFNSILNAFHPRGLRSSNTRFRRLAMYIILFLEVVFHIALHIILHLPLIKVYAPTVWVYWMTWGMAKMENAEGTTRLFFLKVTLTKRFLNGFLYTSAVLHVACLVLLVAWFIFPDVEILVSVWFVAFQIQLFMTVVLGTMVKFGVEDKTMPAKEIKELGG